MALTFHCRSTGIAMLAILLLINSFLVDPVQSTPVPIDYSNQSTNDVESKVIHPESSTELYQSQPQDVEIRKPVDEKSDTKLEQPDTTDSESDTDTDEE